jgi:hypothetical protein
MHTYLPTHSMEQSNSWEANQSLQPVKKFPTLLWNPKVLYRTHKCMPPVPILSWLYPVLTSHPTSWRSILILSSHLRLRLPNGLFPSNFPNYAHTFKFYTVSCLPITAAMMSVTWTNLDFPALRSRVRTALILFLFSSVTFWGRILSQKAPISIKRITCYTNFEEPTPSSTGCCRNIEAF